MSTRFIVAAAAAVVVGYYSGSTQAAAVTFSLVPAIGNGLLDGRPLFNNVESDQESEGEMPFQS